MIKLSQVNINGKLINVLSECVPNIEYVKKLNFDISNYLYNSEFVYWIDGKISLFEIKEMLEDVTESEDMQHLLTLKMITQYLRDSSIERILD